MVLELLLTSVLGAGAFATLICSVVHLVTTRSILRQTRAMQAMKPLTPAMRDEIEQNEAWWLRSFHKLMLASGAEVVARIKGGAYEKFVTRSGGWYSRTDPDRVALEGCICSDCASVIREASKEKSAPAPDPDMEISFSNRRLVAEIQSAYVLPPDGIAGPQTILAIRTRTPAYPMSREASILLQRLRDFERQHSDLATRGYIGHHETDARNLANQPPMRGRCNFAWLSPGNGQHLCMFPAGHSEPHRSRFDHRSYVAVGSEDSVRTPAPIPMTMYQPKAQDAWELQIQVSNAIQNAPYVPF